MAAVGQEAGDYQEASNYRYDQVELGSPGGSLSPDLQRAPGFLSKQSCGCKRWKCLSLFLALYVLIAWLLKRTAEAMQYPGDAVLPNRDKCTDFAFAGADGSLLTGCRASFQSIGAPPTSPKVPFLFFPGNGYGDGGALGIEAALMTPQYKSPISLHPSLEAFSLSYRGYFPNTGMGHASEANIMADAEAFLDAILQQESARRSGGKVLIGGHSLGAAVALELAAKRPEAVAGILVLSPFTSMWDMDLIFWKPWSYAFVLWLWVSDHWDNWCWAAVLPTEIPVAFLSSGNDEIIPATMQGQLFDTFRTERKWFLQTPAATHGDIELEANSQWKGVTEWLQASCTRLPEGC